MSLMGSILGAAAGAGIGAGVSAGGVPDYASFRSRYGDFAAPLAAITVQGKALAVKQEPFIAVTDLRVETTSGFESSIASFRILNTYDNDEAAFRYDEIKRMIFLGASVRISLGYGKELVPVFAGFIADVAFGYEEDRLPYIEVTAMDVKSLMMGGTWSCQLTAKNYGDAVREIFNRSGYRELRSAGVIDDLANVKDTPDKKKTQPGQKSEPSAETIEMVAESDYEFIVKAAKKYNYEFFIDRGKVYFRPAKEDKTLQAKLGVSKGIISFRSEYSITGLAASVEARSTDAGRGTVIKKREKINTTLSTSSRAKKLVGSAAKVYVDPTISSQEQADARVSSLIETMSYRLGSFEAECVGIPDLAPGRFLEASGMGAPADNVFYITSVVHEFDTQRGYRTKLRGCAAEIKPDGLEDSGTSGAGGLSGLSGISML